MPLDPRPSASPLRTAVMGLVGCLSVVLLAVAGAAGATTCSDGSPAAEPSLVSPEDRYGLWTLAPALVAIVTAVTLRQVFPALVVGILTAAAMIRPCLPAVEGYGDLPAVVAVLRLAVERYAIGALTDPSHRGVVDVTRIQTVLFTLTIAGMVGVIHANGGTAALVRRLAPLASTPRRGQLATFSAGLMLFFDDYSNCMIIGPTMRPVLDRLRISREKLSYILDTTAAPIASLALFGTWIGAEVGFIQAGLDQLHSDGASPAFLSGTTAYQIFIWSLPYRFYPLFALFLVFLIGWTGRDFGPMRAYEARARRSAVAADSQAAPDAGARAWYAALPVGALIVVTMTLLFLTGWYRAVGPRTFGTILSNADTYVSILYGAVAALTLAVAISTIARAPSLAGALDAMMTGIQRILPAVAVLVLAWALSDAMKDLRLGHVAVQTLRSRDFSPHLLPALIFVSACIVSFATGTSWGTMGILCPVAVLLAGHLGADLPPSQALPLFYATVGSVLAGAVFGDHCSPISDTTVLSALASECSLETHVWTQLPYALTAAAMELLAGDLLCGYFGVPVWFALLVGAAGLLLFLRAVGRPASPLEGVQPA